MRRSIRPVRQPRPPDYPAEQPDPAPPADMKRQAIPDFTDTALSYDDLGDCVATLLQVQADYAAKPG